MNQDFSWIVCLEVWREEKIVSFADKDVQFAVGKKNETRFLEMRGKGNERNGHVVDEKIEQDGYHGFCIKKIDTFPVVTYYLILSWS